MWKNLFSSIFCHQEGSFAIFKIMSCQADQYDHLDALDIKIRPLLMQKHYRQRTDRLIEKQFTEAPLITVLKEGRSRVFGQ